MVEMVEIYALCCPDTGEIRYVGKANNARKRLTAHLLEKRRRTPLYSWIRKLGREGKAPVMIVLERVPPTEWRDAERRLIASHRQQGRLLNLADGGDEPFCPREVRVANAQRTAAKYWTRESRAENGRKNAKALHSDPKRKRLWRLTMSMSRDLQACERESGYYSERIHKQLVLNCMGLSDLYPDRVPKAWHAVRWDEERFGPLSLPVIQEFMAKRLFDRLDFSVVFA